MKASTHTKLMLIAFIVVLAVIASAISFYVEPEKEVQHIDIEGEWHLVGSQSYDENMKLYTNVKENQNMIIQGNYGSGDACIFYGLINTDEGFAKGDYFTGVYADNKVMFNYETNEGYIRASGNVNNEGNLCMFEAHYYTKIEAPFWYVSYNIYSKDPTLLSTIKIPDSPKVNTNWRFWNGQSSTYDQDYNLSGEAFLIFSQIGYFFKGEMQQNVGSTVITKELIGIFIGKTDKYWIAQIMDQTGLFWNAYIGETTLMMRSVTITEISAIAGQPVGIQRVYYNVDTSIGPPSTFDTDVGLLQGIWTTEGYYDISGNGDSEYHELGECVVSFDSMHNSILAAQSIKGPLECKLYCYAVKDIYLPFDNIFCMITNVNGQILSGYMCLNEDGSKVYQVVFWYYEQTNMNGVTVFESKRSVL